MSNALTMRAVLDSLLPPGDIWQPKIDGDFDKLLDGMAANSELIRTYLKDLKFIRDPWLTPYLADLEKEYGVITNTALSEAERRAALAAVVFAKPGTGSLDLETILRNAGFDVRVISNSPAIDPDQFTDVAPLTPAGGEDAYAGEPTALAGWDGIPGEWIVNTPIYEQSPAYLMQAGGEDAYAGEAQAVAGYFLSLRLTPINYLIPRKMSINDGDFEDAGMGVWTIGPNTIATKEQGSAVPGLGSQVLRIKQTTVAAAQVSQIINFEQNELYVLTGYVRGQNENTQPSVAFCGKEWQPGPDDDWSQWRYFVHPVVATAGCNELFLFSNSPSPYYWSEFDNLMFVPLWNFIFFIAKGVSDFSNLIDGNMEETSSENWSRGPKTSAVKDGNIKATGARSLKVIAENNTDEQEVIPDQPDAALKNAFRMWDSLQAGDDNAANLAWKNWLSDGDMEKQGIGDWGLAVGAPIVTKDTSDPDSGFKNLRIAVNVAPGPYVYQVALTVNKRFRLKGKAKSDGFSYPIIGVNGYPGSVFMGSLSTDWQDFDVEFMAGGTWLQFQCGSGTPGQYVEFDSIHLSQIPDFQDGDMERPVSLIDDGGMEQTGVAAWTPVVSVLTKNSNLPYKGYQCLRVRAQALPGAQFPQALQTNLLIVGQKYRISGAARSDGTQVPFVWNTGAIWVGSSSPAWQLFDFEFTATFPDMFFAFGITNPTGTEYVEFDDLQLEPVSGVAPGWPNDWIRASNADVAKVDGTRIDGGGSKIMELASQDGLDTKVWQNILITNNYYRLQGWVLSDGNAVPKIAISGSVEWIGDTSLDWQQIDIVFQASAGTLLELVVAANNPGDQCFWDDFEISPALYSFGQNVGPINRITEFGPSLVFDGSNDLVNAGAAQEGMSIEQQTMMAWIKPAGLGGKQTIIGNNAILGTEQALFLDNTNLKYTFGNGASQVTLSNNYTDDDKWHHVAAIREYDAGALGVVLRLYIDGVNTSQQGYVFVTPDVTEQTLAIGSNSDLVNFFDGQIVMPMIFTKAMSSVELADEYNRQLFLMEAGSYVEQEFASTSYLPLSGFAWSDGVFGVPMVAIENPATGKIEFVWVGNSDDTLQQEIAGIMTDGLTKIRLYNKFTQFGFVNFDDLMIANPQFEPAEIPGNKKDFFRKLVLKYKPLHSWALLMSNYY